VGEGDPLVVLNGYGGAAADWDPVFVERLGSFADLICIDNRGVGVSELGPEGMTLDSMATDVAAAMAAAEIERAPILGWSMGGYIAQALAAGHRERVESLILLATDPGGEFCVRGEAADWAILTDHDGSPRERADRLLDLLFPESVAAGIGDDVRDVVAAAQAALAIETLTAQQRAMEDWHAAGAQSRLAAIDCPALCAAGRDDRVIPADNSAILAQRLPGSWLARFPDAGHAFMAQYPERLAGLIRAFLGR
jgi:pimeloyl-ACP methyl ester carboxylesterase